MKNIKVIVTYTRMDRDGWPETITTTAWKHEDGKLYEHKIDRDGWPLEVLREDYHEMEEA